MFWNKKTSIEKQKEKRLNVLQLEKLIDRALENANRAVAAFEKSSKYAYSSVIESEGELTTHVVVATEFLSASRFVEQNKKILVEIKAIINNKDLQVPHLILESLKKVEEKNHHADVMFLAFNEILLLADQKKEPIHYLIHEINSRQKFKSDLLQVVISLNDFKDLFRMHFSVSLFDYIHGNRLEELRSIENNDLDLSKLVCLCEELNSAFQYGNYLSVAMLVRAILDHIPPVFGFATFIEVANNYGGKSLKKSLQNLQNSSRNIADAYLHEPIRRKESLPNETQIDFRNDLDVLLAEIVRNLK